jgi:AraC family transcriptional regulator of adaptative response/methylated-DNA-[protein]-cysteine methyltransferase
MVEAMPPRDEMLAAFTGRDGSYDGLFVAAVRTTGIFCRSSCPARKPEPRNVEFFATAGKALAAGYRACLRCRPLDPDGGAPSWLPALIAELERDPSRRWTDADLAADGLRPEAVRRWFQRRFGMTFHAYARARRLAAAVSDLQKGAPVTDAAFDHGYESLSGFSDAIRNLVGTSPGAAVGSTLLAVASVDTPLGVMMLGAAGGKLCLAEFADPERLEAQLRQVCRRLDATVVPGREPPIDRATEQIAEYFAGFRRCFELPLQPAGTDLQRRVWQTLLQIPYGETWTYGQVAAAIGRPRAARPVGRAIGANPIAVVIPCHRVVGSSGALTGYGGGLWRKQRLLELERQ